MPYTYGAERWVQGVEAALAQYLSEQTLHAIATSSPPTLAAGAIALNTHEYTGVSLGATDTKEPTAQWLANVVYDAGAVQVYRVDALVAAAVGGTVEVLEEESCGFIDTGAAATTNYANPISASTLGQPAWAVALLPDQVDCSSGPLDPCGAVPGFAYPYNLPCIYIATVRALCPKGVPWTPLPEAVIGVATCFPKDDAYGVAAALVASGLPPWLTPLDDNLYQNGLMPNRSKPIGLL